MHAGCTPVYTDCQHIDLVLLVFMHSRPWKLSDGTNCQSLPACRDPWVMPMDPAERRAAGAAKARFAAAAGGGSDHLALAAAFSGWQAAQQVLPQPLY